MSETLSNIPVKAEKWLDVYVISLITSGFQITVQNNGCTDLYYSISTTEPAIDSDKYRIIKRGEIVSFSDRDPSVWVFSPQSNGLVNVKETIIDTTIETKTAFGNASAETLHTVIQFSAEYGLLGQVLTVVDSTGSGTNTVVDDKFTCQTGAAADGLASILSLRQLKNRAAQGTLARLDAIFSTGIAGSQQAAGLITSTNSFVFAFAGTAFGIAHAHGGVDENQELFITTPAAGSETAIITVNDVAFNVPLTAGTVQHNAFEIANSLTAQVSNYNFTSNDNLVSAQSLLSGPQGDFLFTSNTAEGNWVQQHEGVTQTLDFIPQSTWNRDTRLLGSDQEKLNPLKGNIYQIKIQPWFGAVKFYIEDSKTGGLVLVHVIEFANLNTIASATNPTYRLGWLAQNLGNTSNVTISGSSAGGFLEGELRLSKPPRSASNNQLSVGLTLTNIITLRNRIHFSGKVNRVEILPLLLTFSSQANKSTFFKFLINPTFGGDLDFSYLDFETSVTEIATDSVPVIGGLEIGSATIAPDGSGTIRFNRTNNLDSILLPNSVLTISAQIASGASSDMQATLSWSEDI